MGGGWAGAPAEDARRLRELKSRQAVDATVKDDETGVRTADSANQSAASATIRLMKPDLTPGSRQPKTPENTAVPASGGHSLSISADAFRDFVNRRSSNDMSEGRILSDKQPVAAVTRVITASQTSDVDAQTSDADRNPVTLTSDSRIENGSARDEQSFPDLTPRTRTPSNRDSNSPDESAVVPSPEATVLDRLRGLYGPASDAARSNLLRRPFERLQSPWNILREQPEHSVVPPQSVAVPGPAAADSNTPVLSVSPPAILDLVAEYESRVSAWPRLADGSPVQRNEFQRLQVDLRILYLLANQPGAAISPAEALAPGEQDFLQESLLALSHFRSTDSELNRQQQLANTAGQLRSALLHLQPLSTLNIRRLEFCNRINSYGSIESFPSSDFNPGQAVLIYLEVENVASKITTDGFYHSQFAGGLRIFRAGETEPIESIYVPEIDDRTTSPRTDYYQSFELTIPSHLTTGRYQIQVTLRDMLTQRESVETLEFHVR